MYLARLTRPCILMPVTDLVTRSIKATVKDQADVQRVIDYIACTPNLGVVLQCTEMRFYLRADASHLLHQDQKGHTGFILALGPNYSYVHARSGEQRLIAHSSTEAEIIAATDCIKLATRARNVVSKLAICPMEQMVLEQDNMSAQIQFEEDSKHKLSKHILMKITYTKDMVTEGASACTYRRAQARHPNLTKDRDTLVG
jgi:hypothetical protein